MNSGHQTTKRIVAAQKKKPAGRTVAVAVAAGAPPAAQTHGIPLASIPHFGAVLTGDKESWDQFAAKLGEIRAFFKYERTHPEYVDGEWKFTAILRNKGIEVPETMTEAEAAKEYLKLTDRFSALLDQWREAVAAGPLDKAADYKSDPTVWRFGNIPWNIGSMLGVNAEAHLQSGDTAGAWADWQAMNHSTARLAELYGGYYGSMDYRTFYLAQSGMRSGAWTDDQLTEISSAVARENVLAETQRRQEAEKKGITDYYMNFHEHEDEFGRDFLETPSHFNQFVNQVKLKLITEQQIRDNMAVKLAEEDSKLSRFDPDTGFYQPPTEEERLEISQGQESAGIFGSFYFMIKDVHGGGGGDGQDLARHIIQSQSQYDQFRLAAALETYQRRTGSYPDHLDAINGQFAEGMPQDIATGQPYYYQRDAGGGYTLWGTGIDGKNDGGNEQTDVTWKRHPRK